MVALLGVRSRRRRSRRGRTRGGAHSDRSELGDLSEGIGRDGEVAASGRFVGDVEIGREGIGRGRRESGRSWEFVGHERG